MTCPNWRRLNDRRDDRPEAWDQALAHLDDCRKCVDEALAVEPTLLFRRLPAPEVGGEDIAAMRQAVATLRRSEETVVRSRGEVGSRFATLRAAALAALLIAAAAIQGVVPAVQPVPGLPGASAEVAQIAHAAPPSGVPSRSAALFDRMPLIEDLDPAFGSAVQVVDDGLSLVLVLPPNDV